MESLTAMCLSKITKRYKPLLEERICWKVFSTSLDHPERLCGPNFGPNGKGNYVYAVLQAYKINRLYRAAVKGHGIGISYSSPRIYYPHGFHAYLTEKVARSQLWFRGCVRRVLLRKIHTRGTQWGKTVLVASEMKILPDPKPTDKKKPVKKKKP